MRIAFFTDSYLPNVDGVVTAIVSYRKELERRGHEVFVFSPGTKKQKKENTDPRVHYFTSAAFKPYPDYRIALFNFFSPVKLVKERQIDIVHSHGIATTGLAAMQTAKKLALPSVASFHTLAPSAVHYLASHRRWQDILENIVWKYLAWYYGHFPRVLAPTEHVKQLLRTRGITHVDVLPNGIDLSRFDPDADATPARKAFGIRPQENVVLHVGRVAKEKNLEMLIEAAPALLNVRPTTKFLIVGKGPAESDYRDMVKKKGLEKHFVFTGLVSDDMLRSCYVAADVLAFPSKFDTQGMAVLEAMASGLPAVAYKESAPAEFVQPGQNGYLFQDGFDFHEKLLQAIKNKKELRAGALETAQRLDVKKAVDRLLEIYQSLASSQKE